MENPKLIHQAKQGDGLAFRKLVEPHLPMLFRVCARVCKNQELVEDAVQETLLIAFQKLAKLKQESALKSFLAGIAVRRGLTLIRSEQRRQIRESAFESTEAFSSQDQILERNQTAIQIEKALMKLPKKRRQVALLKLDAGLSYLEIAETMKTTESSVRVLVHLALKDLKHHLQEMAKEDTHDT